jgi:hypothetical protein
MMFSKYRGVQYSKTNNIVFFIFYYLEIALVES